MEADAFEIYLRAERKRLVVVQDAAPADVPM